MATRSCSSLQFSMGVLGLFMVILLASCGGSSANDGVDTATASADAAQDDDPPVVSELAERIGVDLADEAAVNAWFEQAEVEWRRLTAECMLAEGFEYSQQDAPSPTTLSTDISRFSREWAETYGFGVVPAFLAATYDPAADYETENSRYVASLTPAERDAYQLALRGSTQDETENGFPASGCAGDATAVSFALMNKFEQLGPDMEAYAVRIEADPRMIAIREDWTACMAQAGFQGLTHDTLHETFANRLITIFRSGDVFAYSPGDVPDLPEPDLPSIGPSWRVLPELNAAGQVRVDALLEQELATATAAFDCSEITSEAELKIQFEYEAEFITEFDDKLEEIFPS